MARLFEVIPSADTLLALETEELAGVLMAFLNSLPEVDKQHLNRHNFLQPQSVTEYPPSQYEVIIRALSEAWSWLEQQRCLAPKPGRDSGFVYITPRGEALKTAADVHAYRMAASFPKEYLHPAIAARATADFLRGRYDTAVSEAFREVEIVVRAAGGFGPEDLGVDLMRKAFRVSTGPLSDSSLPAAEQEALGHLFAGAIGRYKNPGSHRHAGPSTPAEAVELLILASHLLRIVGARTSTTP